MYEPSYTDSLRADILPSYSDSLMHHGIKGMHWGIRRYQNPDGSYTSAGKSRRGMSDRTKKNLKRAAIGAAALGAAGLAGYGVIKAKNQITVKNAYKSVGEALKLEQKCRQIADEEVERLKTQNLTDDEIRKSYERVHKIVIDGCNAERKAVIDVKKAAKISKQVDTDDIGGFPYRAVAEYHPSLLARNWIVTLHRTCPDLWESTYKKADEYWDEIFRHRTSQVLGRWTIPDFRLD